MLPANTSLIAEDLDAVIAEIAKLVDCAETTTDAWVYRDEATMWRELVSCILGSAVRAEHARAATNALAASGLLTRLRRSWSESLADDVRTVLSGPIVDETTGRLFRYRFPISRSTSVLSCAEVFYCAEGDGISKVLARFDNGPAARRWFVRTVPGIGPKQASLFLRCVGFAADLAVLDVHILRYLSLHGDSLANPPSSLRAYEALEETFRRRSSHLGLDTGVVDYATWIVMRSLDRAVL